MRAPHTCVADSTSSVPIAHRYSAGPSPVTQASCLPPSAGPQGLRVPVWIKVAGTLRVPSPASAVVREPDLSSSDSEISNLKYLKSEVVPSKCLLPARKKLRFKVDPNPTSSHNPSTSKSPPKSTPSPPSAPPRHPTNLRPPLSPDCRQLHAPLTNRAPGI